MHTWDFECTEDGNQSYIGSRRRKCVLVRIRVHSTCNIICAYTYKHCFRAQLASTYLLLSDYRFVEFCLIIQGRTNIRDLAIERDRIKGDPRLVKFVPVLPYHFCLALPAAFTQPGTDLLAELSAVVFSYTYLIPCVKTICRAESNVGFPPAGHPLALAVFFSILSAISVDALRDGLL